MGSPSLFWALFLFVFAFMKLNNNYLVTGNPNCGPIEANDTDLLQFALNLEYLEADFFLHGARGEGLDAIAPELTNGGPPPIGAQKANLDPITQQIIEEFGYQEVGHLRAISEGVGGLPRPLLDLSKEHFAKIMNEAVGQGLKPPFDPYANSINYLLASYLIPYVGLTGYVGTIPFLVHPKNRLLAAGLLGVEAGQDAVIRTLLYERKFEEVVPYGIAVYDFTNRLSELRNKLGKCNIKDEGVLVPKELGAENRTQSNILSADASSLSYQRTPQEILRIVYGSGDESVPGGFIPKGGVGNIVQRFLTKF